MKGKVSGKWPLLSDEEGAQPSSQRLVLCHRVEPRTRKRRESLGTKLGSANDRYRFDRE